MRLAEVLTQKSIVPVESITDALYVQDRAGESFVDVMIDSGHIAEWDLARVVVESFHLPFLLAGSYQISDEAKTRIPEHRMFENLLMPLDVFGDVLMVSMPVLTTSDKLLALESEFGLKIYPYVGLISENKKVFHDEFPTFKDWHKSFEEERKRRLKARRDEPAKRIADDDEGGGWTNLFDTADQAVRESINKNRG
jgi:hypothetical protein